MLVAVLAVPIIIVITKDLNTANLSNVVEFNGEKYEFVKNIFSASFKDIINGLAWGLGYFGMPHILVRFMAIKKASMAKKSAVVAITWVVLSLGAVIVIAYFGRMLVGDALLSTGRQSMVFIEISRMLFPSFIAGILLSAIIAASMSTADSQLLVASSSFTADIYKPLIRKKASDKEVLWVGRVVVLVVAVVAYFIASSKGDGAQAIMSLVENAWAGFGSAFGPVILLSLFWRRFTYKGALAGVISGALVDVVWLFFLSASTGIYELIPGFAVSMLVSIIVTLIDKKPSEEITAIFDKATANTED
jgi:sodium/proline symporter